MREGPSSDVLAGAFRWRPVVSAWKGTQLLAADVPVVSGRVSAGAGQQVPERVTFTVPEWAEGRSWVPDSPEHPLGQYGQHVDVDIHVWSSVTAADPDAEPTSITRLGRFLVQNWEHDDTGMNVQVECVGLLQRALDARFRTPQVPRPSGTLGSEFRRLMVPGVPVSISSSLTDRTVPQSFQWDEDRLAALYDILDAWPARMMVDQFGTVQVLPALPSRPSPVLSLTDGERGTVISAPRQGTRDDVANVVVARSSATDDPARAPLQAVAQVTSGPLAPASYGEVTYFWSSPLATSLRQLEASAATILARKTRPAVVQSVTCVPDPRIELDDAVRLVRGGRETIGHVVGYDLPLTVGDGSMRLSVGVA